MSLAHLQHPASLQSLHQLHQMHPHPHLMSAHQQQMMWHARSFESGIGIYRHSRYMPDCDNQTPPSHAPHHHPTTLYRTPSIPSVAPLPSYTHYVPICPEYQPQSLPVERIQSFRQPPDGDPGRGKVRRKKSLRPYQEWYDDSSSNAGEETRTTFFIPKPKIISTHSNPLVVTDPFGSVPVVSHTGYWMATPAAVAIPKSRKWPSENDLFPTLKRQHTFRGVTPKRILAEEEASQKCEADFSTGFFLRGQNPGGGSDNNPDGSHEEPQRVKKRCPQPSRLPVRRLSLQPHSELVESPYNHIYGRIPLPTRGYIPPPPRTMYIGEWD
uniref:Uncharacterized protein n=1 Tax=Lutzomyia longipalpis TaxID=7200 RepID=A0A1B0GI17_LUTLO